MRGTSFWPRWSSSLLSLMRVVLGFLYLQHGSQKLFDIPIAKSGPPPDFFSLIGLAGFLEFVGGLLILLGLFTRPVAFLLSGQMAVAYFMAHAPKGLWPLGNGGELAVLYCFAFFYLSAAGAGPWSLDALIRQR
ncbi:MAG: DoxX family protein [Desulfuromonadales bacterium]|jgi:putative oxidoreductase